MRKLCLWLLALLVIFACSPTTQLQDSIAEALTQTQAAQATIFPTFTPGPTRTPYPTRTPLGGGSLPVITPGNFPTPTVPPSDITPEATDPGPYPPPSGPTATPTPSPTAGESKPSNTPTATTSGGGYPAPQTNTPAGPYPPPSVSTFTPTPTFTPSITPSPTPTVDLLFTPSTTPITPSPTITLTPNPNFTPTPSPTPTVTRTPTRTLTPTRTSGPSPTPTITTTPTPALPDLTGLIIDTDDLNAISNIWEAPPEDITYQLQDLGGEVCEVVCVGLQWTSLDSFDTLVLTAYRTADFGDAIQAAFSAQFLYLAQGFELENIPPGIILPDHSWAASKWNQDFVIYTSQGPAVLSFFWHADSPIGTQNTIALLAEYMETQAEILRLNGYITINPNATPLP